MNLVYSYSRFSSAKQAEGSSINRQTEYARRWAADHGMQLDESLSMRDEGLSAYHQKHIKNGALGLFLEAVAAGKIPEGSILIVEGLDRLSRAEPILAQNQLTQIVLAGISVVTASDGKLYSREELKRDPMGLVYSILVMIRANEESETKSRRAAAALRRKCLDWAAGKRDILITSGNDPAWVRRSGSGFELDPVMADTMRQAIRMYSGGYGANKILQVLTDQGRSITGGTQAGNVVRTLTHNPDLFLGHRTVTASGERFILENYYPALITAEEFAKLKLSIDKRKAAPRKAGGKSEFPSIITGQGIAICGHCGGGIVTQNQKRPETYKGPQPIYRRFTCNACATAANSAKLRGSSAVASAVHIERAILDYCSDQMRLDALLAGDDRQQSLRADLISVQAKIAEQEGKVKKFLDAAFDTEDGLPQAIINRVREMEQDTIRQKKREQAIIAELSAKAASRSDSTATAWRDLRETALDLTHAENYEARMKARQLVADTFRNIRVYFAGVESDRQAIDVLIEAHSGAMRWLKINRKTGAMISAVNAEVVEDSEAFAKVTVETIPTKH